MVKKTNPRKLVLAKEVLLLVRGGVGSPSMSNLANCGCNTLVNCRTQVTCGG